MLRKRNNYPKDDVTQPWRTLHCCTTLELSPGVTRAIGLLHGAWHVVVAMVTLAEATGSYRAEILWVTSVKPVRLSKTTMSLVCCNLSERDTYTASSMPINATRSPWTKSHTGDRFCERDEWPILLSVVVQYCKGFALKSEIDFTRRWFITSHRWFIHLISPSD